MTTKTEDFDNLQTTAVMTLGQIANTADKLADKTNGAHAEALRASGNAAKDGSASASGLGIDYANKSEKGHELTAGQDMTAGPPSNAPINVY